MVQSVRGRRAKQDELNAAIRSGRDTKHAIAGMANAFNDVSLRFLNASRLKTKSNKPIPPSKRIPRLRALVKSLESHDWSQRLDELPVCRGVVLLLAVRDGASREEVAELCTSDAVRELSSVWPMLVELLFARPLGDERAMQPRNAADLRQWIAEHDFILEMIAMSGGRHVDGDFVHEAWDRAKRLELRGYPPRPEDPPNGWTPRAERIELDKLRHWLDAYLSDNVGESNAEETRDKAKDADDLTGEENHEACELSDGQLWIKGEPFRLEPPEWNVLEAIAKHDALNKKELGDKSNVKDEAVKVLVNLDKKYRRRGLRVRLPKGKGKGGYWANVKLREAPKS